DPQSLNRYAYAKNDPVNFVDPSGLSCEWVEHRYGVDDLVHPIQWESHWELECHADPIPVLPFGGVGVLDIPTGLVPGGPITQPTKPPTNPKPTQPPKQPQQKQSVNDCIDTAVKKYLGDQLTMGALGYGAWTGMGFVTLALVYTRGAFTLP